MPRLNTTRTGIVARSASVIPTAASAATDWNTTWITPDSTSRARPRTTVTMRATAETTATHQGAAVLVAAPDGAYAPGAAATGGGGGATCGSGGRWATTLSGGHQSLTATLELGEQIRHRRVALFGRIHAAANDRRHLGELRAERDEVVVLGGPVKHDERQQATDTVDVAAGVRYPSGRVCSRVGAVAEEILGVSLQGRGDGHHAHLGQDGLQVIVQQDVVRAQATVHEPRSVQGHKRLAHAADKGELAGRRQAKHDQICGGTGAEMVGDERVDVLAHAVEVLDALRARQRQERLRRTDDAGALDGRAACVDNGQEDTPSTLVFALPHAHQRPLRDSLEQAHLERPGGLQCLHVLGGRTREPRDRRGPRARRLSGSALCHLSASCTALDVAPSPKPPKPPQPVRPSRRMKAQSAPVVAPEAPAPPPPETTQAPVPVSISESRGARSILVVEDDEANRRLIVRALRTAYTVYEAADGEQAAQMLDQHPAFDCVVSDIMMPRLSGTDLARKMRLDARLKGIPVVFVSARRAPSEVADGISVGARFYLTKPFSLKDLLAKVGEAVGKA